jgi:two-component system response regulator RegX3
MPERESDVKVMVVDGDSASRAKLQDDLCNPGIEIVTAEQASVALADYPSVDVVILGFTLTDVDVLQLCQLIREKSNIPIIVVADSDDEIELVLALKIGADDYIVQPYRRRELVARVEAAYRRAYGVRPLRAATPASGIALSHEVKTFGSVSVDPLSRRVTVGSREITLTRKEFDLLALLASDPGRTFTREHIMKEVWGHDGGGDTRTLGVHVASLRKRVPVPGLIETVHGVGFRLGGRGTTALGAAANRAKRGND